MAKVVAEQKHELLEFRACTFGDSGYYYHDGADRAICSCGWKSAAIQRDKTALVALWKAHTKRSQSEAVSKLVEAVELHIRKGHDQFNELSEALTTFRASGRV